MVHWIPQKFSMLLFLSTAYEQMVTLRQRGRSQVITTTIEAYRGLNVVMVVSAILLSLLALQ
jgi:hypothetical protein